MQGLINWDLLNEMMLPPPAVSRSMWNDQAAATHYDFFSKLEREATQRQIETMRLSAEDTCLDIGCGTGRIAVPTAAHVRRVTALDGSAAMLDYVRSNAQSAGVENIDCKHLRWEEVVVGQNVQPHDIVIVSRTEAMLELEKVNAVARKYVYIFLFYGPTLKQFSDELLDGVRDNGPRPPMRHLMPGHVILFNRLATMGIDANVEYLPDGFTRTYPSREAAYQDFTWMNIPADRQERFRQNLGRFLVDEGAGVRLLRETKTAVLWWQK